MTAHSKNGWEGLPRDPREELVWDWLCSLEKCFLSKAPNRLHQTTTSSQFKDERGQLDFFFLPKTAKSTWRFRNSSRLSSRNLSSGFCKIVSFCCSVTKAIAGGRERRSRSGEIGGALPDHRHCNDAEGATICRCPSNSWGRDNF